MKIKAVFQGRHGAYSESAAYSFLDRGIETIPADTFSDLHKMVSEGLADYGVIPIENSSAGSILENYDLLLKHRLPIVGEFILKIDHCLIALKGETVEGLTKVISHWQALAQCSKFFEENPQIKKRPFFDTAGAVERIARKQQEGVGAIASAFAAEVYGLEVLKSPLADFPGINSTRFFLIQKEQVPVDPVLHTKTSIVFFLKRNIPGALHACLSCFATHNVDLIRIESRPKAGSPWEYVFYADLAGNPLQEAVKQSLRELEMLAEVVTLGSYERAPSV
jgi:prephenate dehydratase